MSIDSIRCSQDPSADSECDRAHLWVRALVSDKEEKVTPKLLSVETHPRNEHESIVVSKWPGKPS